MPRSTFQPQLREPGESIAALNAEFRAQAAEYSLRFRCDDCVYFDAAAESCTLGWKTADLRAEPIEMLDEKGEPAFCKAFEPIDS